MAEKGPTVFGWVMAELMMSRGITSQTGLSARMQEHGYDYQPGRLSGWMHGKSAVNRSFPSAFAEVLDLDDEERRRLADAFTYGQEDKAWSETGLKTRKHKEGDIIRIPEDVPELGIEAGHYGYIDAIYDGGRMLFVEIRGDYGRPIGFVDVRVHPKPRVVSYTKREAGRLES